MVLQKIDEQLNAEIARNRKAVVILCGKQDIALRGHNENEVSQNRGKFREILELQRTENKETNEIFSKLHTNANYQSPEIQNKLISVVGAAITDMIVKDVNESVMFSIMADEARDVSCSEQMSTCIRYVKDALVFERFVKFVNVQKLDARSLTSALVENMKNLGLNLAHCVGQCYDGASVMSGRLNGVQVHVRMECKSPCLYVHCYAHRINLVVVDACNNSKYVIEALGLMEAIYCFTNASTLRHENVKAL
jgi:Domain of unknown function (DUF4371)